MLAKAAVIKSDASGKAAWKKTYHLETKVVHLKHSHANLQDAVNKARAQAHEEVELSEAEVTAQMKNLEDGKTAVHDATDKLQDALAHKQVVTR